MRKALVVGLNYYPQANDLFGCVNDAKRVSRLLKRHGDNMLNFDVKEIYGEKNTRLVSRRALQSEITQLFTTSCDVALFYFAGHGYADDNGVFILTSECKDGDDGVPVSFISNILQHSHARNNIVIFDCCQAGAMGQSAVFGDNALIPPNTTFLLACKEDQYSQENNGNGVFTDLLVDALSGGASNLVGEISPGSVYSYIDQALSLWEQRPVFKTNVEKFISIRNVKPPISLDDLRQINKLFPTVTYKFPLDPSYEPTSECADKENTKVFSILQKYNRLNLLVPVNEEHMYYAAINSQTCELTPLGVHYWNLVEKDRI